MRSLSTAVVFFFLALALVAQTDRGTMTGTISGPAGAVVANAAIEARNTETGAQYQVASSATGNYTIPNLPTGTYQLSVTVPGFKKFIRTGLTIQAAQTIRVDAAMEVGSAAESVTVTEAAPLLKTESGELSNTVATKTMDTLPLLSVGSNSSGIRNPFNLVALLPGAFYQPSPSFTGPTVRINGGVSGSEKVLIDGMDGTNILGQGANQQAQPGMDSIQEWTVQTSNYSAEFGQAGSAVMNVTMKSGTNQYHGSLYEYYQNDILNAAQPFTVQQGSPNEHNRPTVRRNDYGLTLGGPVDIPKVYNGRDKTFFFFSWEQFLQNQNFLPGTFTVTGYGEDGAPQPISGTFGGGIYSHRERLNYDHTVSPTILLHLGAGYDQNYLGRPSVTPNYDPCGGLGLCSQAFQSPATFPLLTGLNDTVAGGTSIGGPPGRADNAYSIVDTIASLTWVKGNHTFKFGGNGEFMGSYTNTVSNISGTSGFTPGQTAMPYAVTTSTGVSTASFGPNHIGLPYASFLLGAVDNAEVDPPSKVRFGKQQWGFYAQDLSL